MLKAALFTEARDWKRMNGAQCGVHLDRVPPRPPGRGVSPGPGSTPLGDRRRRETPQRVIPLGETSNVQNGRIRSERRSGVAGAGGTGATANRHNGGTCKHPKTGLCCWLHSLVNSRTSCTRHTSQVNVLTLLW